MLLRIRCKVPVATKGMTRCKNATQKATAARMELLRRHDVKWHFVAIFCAKKYVKIGRNKGRISRSLIPAGRQSEEAREVEESGFEVEKGDRGALEIRGQSRRPAMVGCA